MQIKTAKNTTANRNQKQICSCVFLFAVLIFTSGPPDFCLSWHAVTTSGICLKCIHYFFIQLVGKPKLMESLHYSVKSIIMHLWKPTVRSYLCHPRPPSDPWHVSSPWLMGSVRRRDCVCHFSLIRSAAGAQKALCYSFLKGIRVFILYMRKKAISSVSSTSAWEISNKAVHHLTHDRRSGNKVNMVHSQFYWCTDQ